MGERILIVEDDKMLLELMKVKLEDKGYRVKQAEDGFEALAILERNKIDLIISDIMMPNLSGLSLLSILHEFNTDRIPVIIISSLNKASIIITAMELGIYDFIVKPVNFEELCKKISILLNKDDLYK